jgi:hypothetical protein
MSSVTKRPKIETIQYLSKWSIKHFLDRFFKYTYFTPILIPTCIQDLGLMKLDEIQKRIKTERSFICTTHAEFRSEARFFTALSRVYVFCNKCFYLNILPFHFANSFKTNERIFKHLYHTSKLRDLHGDLKCHETKNFNYFWVNNAQPSNVITLKNDTDTNINTFVYDCPRCVLSGTQEDLQYIYRFAFCLQDKNNGNGRE